MGLGGWGRCRDRCSGVELSGGLFMYAAMRPAATCESKAAMRARPVWASLFEKHLWRSPFAALSRFNLRNVRKTPLGNVKNTSIEKKGTLLINSFRRGT